MQKQYDVFVSYTMVLHADADAVVDGIESRNALAYIVVHALIFNTYPF